MIEAIPGILTILVVGFAMPLNWYVTLLLWKLARADPDGVVLRVVAVLSASVALIVTVFALIFINNTLHTPVLNARDTMIITRGGLLVLSVVPSIYWLRWYRRKNGEPS